MSSGANKRRTTDKEKRGRYADASLEFKKILRDKGINPALPWGLVSSKGDLAFASPRLLSILALDRRGSLEFPIEKLQWENQFHFFTEEHSKAALIEKIFARIEEQKSLLIVTENRMKTFRILLKPLQEIGSEIKKNPWFLERVEFSKKTSKSSKWGLLFVEVLRAGDLLKDPENRQALFRSFSHELRTSVMTLKGMIEMAISSNNPNEQLGRMKESVKRIERIVERLGELRSKLGLDDGELEKNQKKLKKV